MYVLTRLQLSRVPLGPSILCVLLTQSSTFLCNFTVRLDD